MTQARPRVSVIMRTKNSAGIVAQALAGLFAQDYQGFELIVVDSGSTDATLDIVARYPAKLVKMEPGAYYSGAALNLGIEHSEGEIIVCQNSDAVPLDPHVLRKLISALDDPQVVAAFARQLPRPDAKTWVRRDYAASFPAGDSPPNWMTLSVPMAAMLRSIWEHHPFTMEMWLGEDTEWGNWARTRGYLIKYVRDALVMHSHNYTLRQLYGRRFGEGEAHALTYRSEDTPFKALLRTISDSIRDVVYYLNMEDFGGLLGIPLRRLTFHWAFYKGHKHGEWRIATDNRDASVGQAFVMNRYEK